MESILQQIDRYQQGKNLQADLVSEFLANRLIVVLGEHNLVKIIEKGKEQFQAKITSGRGGFSNLMNSGGSPIGLMRIRSKIGNNNTNNGFFINRELRGEFDEQELEFVKDNKQFLIAPIISRILTLEGLEAYNLSVLPRSIYFHGTRNGWILYDDFFSKGKVFLDRVDDNRFNLNKDGIGETSFDMPRFSHGCFGMLKDDVIRFSELVNEGDLVLSLPSNS